MKNESEILAATNEELLRYLSADGYVPNGDEVNRHLVLAAIAVFKLKNPNHSFDAMDPIRDTK